MKKYIAAAILAVALAPAADAQSPVFPSGVDADCQGFGLAAANIWDLHTNMELTTAQINDIVEAESYYSANPWVWIIRTSVAQLSGEDAMTFVYNECTQQSS